MSSREAFSIETKFRIKERAGGTSELSGENDRPLQCSHFNHNKQSPFYDSEEMGILVTDIEHYAYHVKYLRNPEKIGLTKKENKRAIKGLLGTIFLENVDTIEEIYGRYIEARTRWDEYEKENFSQDPRAKIIPQSVAFA